MSSSSPSRSPSRKSSPYLSQANGIKAQAAASRTTSAQGGWVEPPLRQPAPSFQDHGLGRAGVVENMMPLGTPPTARVRARAKGEPLRKVVQARHLASSGMVIDESRATPEAAISSNTRASSGRTEQQPEGSANIDPQLMVDPMDFPEFPTPTYRPQTPSQDETPPAQQGEQEAVPDIPLPLDALHDEHEIAQTPNYASTPQGPMSPSGPGLTPSAGSVLARPPSALSLTSPAPSNPLSYTPSTVPPGSPFFTANSIAKRNGRPEVQQPLAYLYSAIQQDPELEALLNAALDDATNDNPIKDRKSALGQKIKRVKQKYRAQAATSPLYQSPFTNVSADVPRQASSAFASPLKHNPTTIGRPSSQTSFHQHSRTTSSSLPQRHAIPRMTSGSLPPASGNDAPTGQPLLPSRRASSSPLSSTSSRKIEALESSAASHPSLKRTLNEAGSLLDASDEAMEVKRKRMRRDFAGVDVSASNVRRAPSQQVPAYADQAASPKPELKLKFWPLDVRPEATEAYLRANGEGPATPTALGRPPSNKKKVAPRTKMSPNKNQRKVAVAGLARPEQRRRGTPADDDKSEASDNNDYCSACGGPGYLLCCDGCDRSFHFTCLDPPFDPDAKFDKQWYCSRCEAQRDTLQRPPQGLFADLEYNIMKNNEHAFTLPQYIRDNFKDVRTGTSGEYIPAFDQRPIKGGRIGYDNDNVPDYKKLRDAKGNAILCYACGESSLGGRDIIPCDYCVLNWHLDCLNPPLANPPYRGNFTGIDVKTRPAWMCPAHADHEIKRLDRVHGSLTQAPELPTNGAKIHRMRRPAKPVIVPVHMRRGFANNGMIEVESETDESGFESEEGPDNVVYKLPRHGIKLDFIDKVKHDRYWREQEAREVAALINLRTQQLQQSNERRLAQSINQRTLEERKAVLNLVQFKEENKDLDVGEDELENLLYTLEAEASPEVIALMKASAHTPSEAPVYDYGTRSKRRKQAASSRTSTNTKGLPSPSPSRSMSVVPLGAAPTNRQRDILLRMQAQIQRLLDSGEHAEASQVNGV